MKWKTNDVRFVRGSYAGLIAQFDGAGPWFILGALATAYTQKSEFKRLGEYLDAEICEVKYAYDDDDMLTERCVVFYRFSVDGTLKVADEVGQRYMDYCGRFEDFLKPVEG